MLQELNGRMVFVAVVPDNPASLLPIDDGGDSTLTHYAEALDAAIRTEIVKEAGKYAIEINENNNRWTISKIFED